MLYFLRKGWIIFFFSIIWYIIDKYDMYDIFLMFFEFDCELYMIYDIYY